MSARHGPGARLVTVALLVLVSAVAIGSYFLSPLQLLSFDQTAEGATELIRSWGAWGVLGSIGLMVVHSFVPFPAEILACANGMVYGPLWGTVITWVGAMLGASAAFGLARWLGRPFVQRIVSPRHRQQLAVWSEECGGISLLIGRLIPVIAFNLINYAAALTEISWWTFLWATGIGILPLTILLNVMGDRMLTIPLWGWMLIGAVAIVAWLVLHWHWRTALRRKHATTGLVERSNQ